MDFALTEAQEAFRASMRQFAEQEVAPWVQRLERTDETSTELLDLAAKCSLMGLHVPREFGGVGLGHLYRVIAIKEIARVSPSFAFLLQMLHVGMAPILDAGNADQRSKYLADLACGRRLAALAITETSGGSDPAGIRCQATKEADVYVLNGRKIFVTNAGLADVFVVTARTGVEKGDVGAFVVERAMPGFREGRRQRKLGLRGCEMGQVIFEDCEVPEANLLSGERDGLRIVLRAVSQLGRVGAAACAVGILQACLDITATFAKHREVGSRPIAKLQGIQWIISEMYLDVEIAKALCYRAAWLIDQDKRCDADIAAAKFYATEAAVRCTKKAVNVRGGYGCLEEKLPERLYRDAICLIPAAGTSEIMRLIMARAVAGL